MRLTSPGVGNNKIYLGTTDGIIRAYGSPVQSPFTGGAVGFPNTTVGSSATVTDTFTASQALTVTAAVGVRGCLLDRRTVLAAPPHAGQGRQLHRARHLRPDRLRRGRGTLTVTTSVGAYTVGLNGDGLNATPLLTVAPKAISFEGTAIGAQITADAIFSNQGSQTAAHHRGHRAGGAVHRWPGCRRWAPPWPRAPRWRWP